MSDLISKSALIEEVQKCFVNGCIHRNDLAEILANLPTVEAKPVVHGKWENGMKCSQCGQIDWTKPNFCPNCGAKMK